MSKVLIHDPGDKFVITEIFAFCSVDEGGEGVVAAELPILGFMPLIGADMARIDDLRPYAQEIANLTNKKIVLKKFSTPTIIETLHPKD